MKYKKKDLYSSLYFFGLNINENNTAINIVKAIPAEVLSNIPVNIPMKPSLLAVSTAE
jgi:hypothetical protein